MPFQNFSNRLFKTNRLISSFISSYFVRKRHIGKALLGCTVVGAANNKIIFPTDKLSYEDLIKQACVTTINASTTLLTTTAATVIHVGDKYKHSLTELLVLLEHTAMIDGVSEELSDRIIEVRATVSKTKNHLVELEKYMETVEKLVYNTSESAFLAGAEYLCTTLLERLESTKKEIEKEVKEIKKLEAEYLELQKALLKKKINVEN